MLEKEELIQMKLVMMNWRMKEGPIRTAIEIKLPLNEEVPVYQKLASKIKRLKALGITNQEIRQQS